VIRSLSTPWTLAVKVPAAMAAAVVVIAAATTALVYQFVSTAQDRQLASVTRSYLDGLAPALVEPVLRGDIWGVFEILDQPRSFSTTAIPVELAVADTSGEVIAASDPRKAPSGAPLPARFRNGAGGGSLVRDDSGEVLSTTLIVIGGRSVGSLHVLWDITPMTQERRMLIQTAALWTILVPALVGLAGWFATRRMMRPVQILSRHMETADDGSVQPIGGAVVRAASREFARLYRSFNTMAGALEARRALTARLVAEERLSSLGRIAAGVAHEINNPLGGLFATLHMLKTDPASPTVQQKAVALLERGLGGIRDVVRALLAIHRPERNMRPIAAADFDDLRILIGPQIGSIRLTWSIGPLNGVDIAGGPVRQMVLNLLLNALAAAGENGDVGLTVAAAPDKVVITVTNSGSAMSGEIAAFLEGRGTADVPGDGLGVWLVRQIAAELRARVTIRTGTEGTSITVIIPRPISGAT